MFELLQAYETATNEKNKFLRKVYTKYVQHKLKKSFFEKFDIDNIELTDSLIEEFKQFFCCTPSTVKTGNPKVFYISSYGSFYIDYDIYHIRFSFLEDHCDIEIDINTDKIKTIVIHPENELFYSSFWVIIILMAIYN